jgi:hypothetical protein
VVVLQGADPDYTGARAAVLLACRAVAHDHGGYGDLAFRATSPHTGRDVAGGFAGEVTKADRVVSVVVRAARRTPRWSPSGDTCYAACTASDPEETTVNFTRLNRWWPLVLGGVGAPVVLTVLIFLGVTDGGITFYQWLLWLHLPLLWFHEYEEYFLPGGFKRFFNTETPLAADPPSEDVPLNDPYEFAVNAFFWTVIIAGALLANVAPWVGLIGVMGQLCLNNFTHTVVFQSRHRGYNPGLITTVFVLMPYCTLVIAYIIANGVFTTTDWVLGLVFSVLPVLVMLAITTLRRKHAASTTRAAGA